MILVGSVWRWNRWYSRNHLMAMVTGLGTTALGRRRLVNLLVEQHKLAPYDAMYQFSTIEVFRSTAGPAEASHNGAPSERPCGGGAAMDAERARTVTAL